MTHFDIVLRGYHRFAVDALMQAVDAAAGDRDRIDAAVRDALPFTMVLRGYRPEQVDAWLAASPSGVTPAGTGSGVPALDLLVVLRGYRMADTDALLTTVAAALAGDNPFRRAEALAAITAAQLPVTIRGYHRGQVDAYLKRAEQTLRAS